MGIAFVRDLAAHWRADAQVLRRRGAAAQAETLESCAEDLEERYQAWETEKLTIHEAALESGYSEDHLRALVREGSIPDARSSGSDGTIRIRRRDLPRKPGQRRTPVEELASTIRHSKLHS